MPVRTLYSTVFSRFLAGHLEPAADPLRRAFERLAWTESARVDTVLRGSRLRALLTARLRRDDVARGFAFP